VTEAVKASVLIPTHNRCDLLLKTLASLERQTVPPTRYEVVICIDGYGDTAAEAIELLDPSFTLRSIVQKNSGIAAARNRAARIAEHQILVFLDDDQLACPEFLEAHLDVHARGREVLVQGPYPLADGFDRRGASLIYDESLLRVMRSIGSSDTTSWHLWGNNFSVRATTWEKVGGFDETFRAYGGEDTDFGLRLTAMGIPFVYEPRAVTRHMHHVTQASFRRQSFSSGRAVVDLARKHNLRVAEFSGISAERMPDRLCFAGWRRAPWLMEVAGRVFSTGLALADVVRVKQAQLAFARAVRRLYRLGGIALESARVT